MVPVLDQPHVADWENPSTLRAMPVATSAAPRQSIRPGVRVSGIRAASTTITAATATGMLTQKIARHE